MSCRWLGRTAGFDQSKDDSTAIRTRGPEKATSAIVESIRRFSRDIVSPTHNNIRESTSPNTTIVKDNRKEKAGGVPASAEHSKRLDRTILPQNDLGAEDSDDDSIDSKPHLVAVVR